MTSPSLQNIIILGAQAEAPLAALSLAQQLTGLPLNITVIEPPLAIDEKHVSLLAPDTHILLHKLGIDLRELIKHCRVGFSLGTLYKNWHSLNQDYFHPFAAQGIDKGFLDFHQFANKLRLAGENIHINQFSLASQLALSGKFTLPVNDPKSLLSTLSYGIQVNTSDFRHLIKRKALSVGIQIISTEIDHINLDQQEYITSLRLSNGQVIDADFFIDASGSQRLLRSKQSVSDIKQISEQLGYHHCLTLFNESTLQHTPYTTNIATTSGFISQVSSENNTQYDIYYDKNLGTPKEYESLLQTHQESIQSKPVGNYYSHQCWYKNSLVIGQAAFDTAPLWFSPVECILQDIDRFVALFPPQKEDTLNAQEYNRLSNNIHTDTVDFYQMHYLLSERVDSVFWQSRKLLVSDNFQHNLKLFKSHGRLPVPLGAIKKQSLIATYLGHNQWPEHYHPLVDMVSFTEIKAQSTSMRHAIHNAIEHLPSLQDFLAKVVGK